MIPISKSVDLEAAAKGTLMENPSEFRSLVQRLNFVASNTRPDIAVAVNLLSRHAKQPTSELMQIALKVLAYLKTTRGVVLLYERMEQLAFNLYSDASFKRKGAATTIGVACMINGTAFSWDVYKDRKAYTSANEAEFAAIYQAARSSAYFVDLMRFIGVQVETPVEIECDNSGAVAMSEKSVQWDSRDADPEQLKVVGMVREKQIIVRKIDTELNPADLLTKPLESELFRRHLYTLGLAGYDASFDIV